MRDGDPARYAHGADLRGRIRRNLEGFDVRADAGDGLKRAAVVLLVAPCEGAGEAGFVLTRRASRLSSHSGQWALPGGRVDAGETVRQAALREVHEEVGLALPDEALLGALDDYPTRSGYCISPFVAWLPAGADLVPNPDEVESVHRIPFAALERPDSPELLPGPDTDRPVLRIWFHDFALHAPTAAVVHQAHEVAILGRATRVAHFDQPKFAWR